MKIAVVSGSNRAQSGSRKVADYIEQVTSALGEEVLLLDMHEIALPLWSEDMWDSNSPQSRDWHIYKKQLIESDAIVLIAGEWHGTIPPSLHNFIMHLDRETVGHKPTLLVGVSAGIGGTYPIAELRSFASKNNRMLFIPDHVIVRSVNGDFDDSEHPIGPRIKESINELVLYAKHMKVLRGELEFDYKQFDNGM